jgi:hypothetical protein
LKRWERSCDRKKGREEKRREERSEEAEEEKRTAHDEVRTGQEGMEREKQAGTNQSCFGDSQQGER